jgi:hypothetical protein
MTGFTAKEAKIKAGAPCEESNIMKRGKALVKAGNLRQKLPHKGPASQKPAKLKSAFRLRPGQVEQLAERSDKLKRLHTEAFKKVTAEAQEAVQARAKGQKRRSVAAMVEEANAALPVGTPLVAVSSVTEAVRKGAAGQSPKKRG